MIFNWILKSIKKLLKWLNIIKNKKLNKNLNSIYNNSNKALQMQNKFYFNFVGNYYKMTNKYNNQIQYKYKSNWNNNKILFKKN
jgi:hypothetical protein